MRGGWNMGPGWGGEGRRSRFGGERGKAICRVHTGGAWGYIGADVPHPQTPPPSSSRYRQRLKVTGPARPPTLLRGPGDTDGGGSPGGGCAALTGGGGSGAARGRVGTGTGAQRRGAPPLAAAAPRHVQRGGAARTGAAGTGNGTGTGTGHRHPGPRSGANASVAAAGTRGGERGWAAGRGTATPSPPPGRSASPPSVRPCTKLPCASTPEQPGCPRPPTRGTHSAPTSVPPTLGTERVHLPVCPSIHPFIHPPSQSWCPESVCPIIQPPTPGAQSPSVHPSVHSPIHPAIPGAHSESIYLSILPSIHLPSHPWCPESVYLSSHPICHPQCPR